MQYQHSPSTLEILDHPEPPAVMAVAPVPPAAPFVVTPARPAAPYCPTVIVSGVAHLDFNGTFPYTAGLWQDSRATGPYLLGHNPGSGSFILGLQVGGCLRYGGRTYRITRTQTVGALNGGVWLWSGILTLQTCVVPNGSVVRIVQAVPA